LIAAGETKQALEQAKALHRCRPSAETEQLVVRGYLARIEAMIEGGMNVEAGALIDLVVERYPAYRQQVLQRRSYLAARNGDVAELLRPLADPELCSERRHQVHEAIIRWVLDPTAVANCDALPGDHPLRSTAGAVATAFCAVTTGPVTDEQIALPTISRRSPWAPWKMLIRALAAFYRQDDETCRRILDAVVPRSAPTRLVPVIRSMMDGTDGSGPKGAMLALRSAVSAEQDRLRQALRAAERALEAGRPAPILKAVRRAVSLAKHSDRALFERLRQHLSVRCLLVDVSVEKVRKALGGSSLKDAYFWRLYARAYEQRAAVGHDLMDTFYACSLWEEFRRHAIAEKWLPEHGPELAALYLRMIELLSLWPYDEVSYGRRSFERVFQGHSQYYADQPLEIQARSPKELVETNYVYPEQLYERAAQADPDPQIYQQWLQWALQTHKHWRPADTVAQTWHRALAADVRPLLHLALAAERRGAFKKALDYLAKAEALDAMNAQVRHTRLRLLVATAKRHFGGRKLHLAERDIEQLAALEIAGQGDGPAFVAALRWCASVLAGDDEAARNCLETVVECLAELLPAVALLAAVAAACRVPDELVQSCLPPPPALVRQGELAVAAARASELGQQLALRIDIPVSWVKRIIEDLDVGDCGLQPRQLGVLAQAALRQGDSRLAYALTRVGLGRAGPHVGRFLLWRAKCLPRFTELRWTKCLRACIELANQRGDTELVDDALETLRGRSSSRGRFGLLTTSETLRPMAEPQVRKVVQRERQATGYPSYGSYNLLEDWDEDDEQPLCDCPTCRRRRGEAATDDEPSPFTAKGRDDDLPLFARQGRDDDDFARRGYDGEDDEGDEDDEDYDFECGDGGAFSRAATGKLPLEAFLAVAEAMSAEFSSQLPGVSEELTAVLMECILKHGRPDGTLPSTEQVFEKDPELGARYIEALAQLGGAAEPTGSAGSTGSAGPGSSRRRRSKAKRRGRRRRR